MSLVTFLARVSDSMLLVATMDNAYELEEYKQHAKKIIKTLNQSSPLRSTIEAGPYFYHYIIEHGVCYLTLAERGYPKRLVFQYLEELQREFQKSHAQEVHTYSRPYAAVQFDPKMNRIRREYLDPRSPANVKKLNSDLTEIHNIMSQNIQEVLRRGERLESVQGKTNVLIQDAKQFDKKGRAIYMQQMYRKYGPMAFFIVVVLLVLYIRFLR